MNTSPDTYLLDNLRTAIVLLDAKLCVQHINPAAEALFEVSDARALGHSITQLFFETAEALAVLQSAVTGGHSFTKRGVLLTSQAGKSFTVDYVLSPIVESTNRYLLLEILPHEYWLHMSKEEVQLSKQAANKMLVRGLAHEIKNPLGGIRGAAQLLAEELPAPLQDYTDVIIQEADRLCALVDRMLGSHKLPMLGAANIHELLEHVCQLIEIEAQGTIVLLRDYDPSIPELLVDREQMIQVVLNIMRNAMQALAGQECAQISVRSRALRQYTIGMVRHRLVCQIEIIDNGPGIPIALQQTIFYPMVSGRAEGSGLGLSIAQTIISQHHGLIECASKPGNTLFRVLLPLTQEMELL